VSWIYRQRTGELCRELEGGLAILGHGYSGIHKGKNNPDMEHIKGIGPIPCGEYDVIGPPTSSVIRGPYVLGLLPTENTDTHNRFGFLIHGDSVANPGLASHGCIILRKNLREAIWTSNDHKIRVVKE
jgi:hypothetical protein